MNFGFFIIFIFFFSIYVTFNFFILKDFCEFITCNSFSPFDESEDNNHDTFIDYDGIPGHYISYTDHGNIPINFEFCDIVISIFLKIFAEYG
jgi:hypothetical protein